MFIPYKSHVLIKSTNNHDVYFTNLFSDILIK